MGAELAQTRSRILVIDDNQQIHVDFRKILGPPSDTSEVAAAEAALFGSSNRRRVADTFDIDSAFQGREGLALLERALTEGNPYALAFVDIRMPPGWDGIETIAHLWKVCPELQVVVCSAYSDYSWPDIVHRLGRSDSLVVLRKPFDNVEVLQLAHAMTRKWALARAAKLQLERLDERVRQRTAELAEANAQLRREMEQHAQALAELRLSEERFSKAFRATPIALALQRTNGQLLDFNDAFVSLTGHPSGALMGKAFKELGPWAPEETPLRLEARLAAGSPVRNLPGRLQQPGGRHRDVRISAEPLNLHGEPGSLLILVDDTDQIRLESQLRHSQKMEAVGLLASGVAHDFNNLLTVIQGYVSLQLTDERLDQSFQAGLEQIQSASQRAATLTRQLLTFSRKNEHQPRPIRLSAVATALRPMLVRLIGEHIQLELDSDGQDGVIQGDESNLEQVIMNLVVNARDAMPKGGRVVIRIGRRELATGDLSARPGFPPGPYVCLTVSDTGCGMDPAVAERIFEPFFTTKEEGKGTGLGLSTVYGIVQQHGGWVQVQTEAGKGSHFRVFLPISQASLPPAEVQPAPPPSESTSQGQRILVVEDDQSLRELIKKVLLARGYSVRTLPSGAEARALVEREGIAFDLLVTDILMPGGVNGVELADALRRREPNLRVLFISGYCPEQMLDQTIRSDDTSFLAKPFKPADLLLRVRRQFDRH